MVENPNSQFAEYVNSSLSTIEGVSIPNRDLNIRIQEELYGVIKELKSGKATYLDEISNDSIKFASRALSIPRLHLFNTIMNGGWRANNSETQEKRPSLG